MKEFSATISILKVIAIAGCIELNPLEDDEVDTPLGAFRGEKVDDDTRLVTVYKLIPHTPLEDIRVYLHDHQGYSVTTDILALHSNRGQWQGLDVTWDNDTSNYTDPPAAQARIDKLLNGSDGSEPLYLKYRDKDRNGKLSPDDELTVYDGTEGGDDFQGYKVMFKFIPNDEIIGQPIPI